ncbi:hypothetical protein BJY22_007974 [Kribbella shirazensis]|uniref:Uncharacterized protein n=1 Tax=Kribbella shirazensis TaxID=1105143 RepID=A0A7X5VKT1_9ACTN|nr:hypothetical protein [Kribbella shirazensis]
MLLILLAGVAAGALNAVGGGRSKGLTQLMTGLFFVRAFA